MRSELAGKGVPDEFLRLRELLTDGEGHLSWVLQGERRTRADGGADLALQLRLDGEVRVPCIRCLNPVQARLHEARLFRVTASESQAERFDAEHDEADALVADPRFDVLELIEDEAIMALPIAPRHANCALPAELASEAPAARENPFAVLATLQRRESGDEDA